MSKQSKAKTIKVLSFFKDENSVGFIEWEIDPAILKKSGKQLYKSNPDLFGIFLGQIQRKLREIFEF